MTTRKMWVIWIWTSLVAAMGIFPPWAYDQLPSGGEYAGGDTPLISGYRFIGMPHGIGRIDVSRLFVQCAVVSVIAVSFYFAWPLKPAAPAPPSAAPGGK